MNIIKSMFLSILASKLDEFETWKLFLKWLVKFIIIIIEI